MKINPETGEVTFNRAEMYVVINTPFADVYGSICRLAVEKRLLQNLYDANYKTGSLSVEDADTVFKLI